MLKKVRTTLYETIDGGTGNIEVLNINNFDLNGYSEIMKS